MQHSGQPPVVVVSTMSPNQAPGYPYLGTPGQSGKLQRYQNYKTKASIGLGITQIILGTILIVFNTATSSIGHYYYYNFGQGFWSGALVIIAGVFAILAGKYPNRCYIIASLVLSVIAASLAGISALVSGFGYASPYYYYSFYGILLLVLTSLMLVVSVAGCVLSIILSAFSCKVLSEGQGNNHSSGQPGAMPRPDMVQEFSSKPSVDMTILGCVQCINGLACLAFGIFSLVVKSSMSVTGHGIWCGIVVIAHGIFAILFGRRNSRPLMIVHLVLAIIVCVLAIAAFSIALVGMSTSEAMRRYEIPKPPQVGYGWLVPTPSPTVYNKLRIELRIEQIAMECVLVVVTLCAFCCGLWGSILSCSGSMKCCQPNIYKQQPTYSVASAKFAGVGQFVVGAMCWAFSAAAIALQSYVTSSGSGLDAGTMFMISGIFGYMSGVQKRKPWIVAAMVLAIISSLFVVLLVVHGILGIEYTAHVYCENYNGAGYRPNYYDGYSPYDYYRPGSCYQKPAQFAVHTMHIVMGVAQLVFLVWSSGIACKLCCCSQSGTQADVSQVPTVMYSQSPQQQQQQQQPMQPDQAQVFFYQNGQLIPAHVIVPNQGMALAPIQTGAFSVVSPNQAVLPGQQFTQMVASQMMASQMATPQNTALPANETQTQPATPPPAYDNPNFEKEPLPE